MATGLAGLAGLAGLESIALTAARHQHQSEAKEEAPPVHPDRESRGLGHASIVAAAAFSGYLIACLWDSHLMPGVA